MRQATAQLHISGRQWAGYLAALGSFATTWACIAALSISGWPGFGIALVVEVVLYQAKKLAFQNHKETAGWAAVLLDTLLNAGGIWPYTSRLNATPTWLMIAQGFQLDSTLGPLAALVISLVLGFVLSVLPHRLLAD